MPASWGVVPNYTLSRTGVDTLPSWIPGLTTNAPGGTNVRVDANNSLVVSGECLDTVRAFCMAHAATPVTCQGALPSLFVTTQDESPVRVVLGYRPDLAQRSLPVTNLGQVGLAAAL